MKGIPLQPVSKGLGVCSKGVLKQPLKIITSIKRITRSGTVLFCRNAGRNNLIYLTP